MLAIFLAALLLIPVATYARARGSSGGGGGSGGSSGLFGEPKPLTKLEWDKLPDIKKKIVFNNTETRYSGDVKFDVKVTVKPDLVMTSATPITPMPPVGSPPQAPPPINPIDPALLTPLVYEEKNAFTISFQKDDPKDYYFIEKSFPGENLEKIIRTGLAQLEREIGERNRTITSKFSGYMLAYHDIFVEIMEHSPQDLRPQNSGRITLRMFAESRGNSPMSPPVVSNTISPSDTFVNEYMGTGTPKPDPSCPDKQEECCKPPININIKNENNSSANNNNTNVGRDQINGNTLNGGAALLDRYNHFAYVQGYPDHSFRPEGTIQRSEMTAIFRRLMDPGMFTNGGGTTPFRDVKPNHWYSSDIARLTSIGVISGYPDGSFKPAASVTRGEFANVASKFVSAKAGQGFNDTNGHWAGNAISKLQAAGLVKGYADGSFKPDALISRAEAVSIVNRMLERQADAQYLQNNKGNVTNYIDLTPGHWAYLDIMEASNSHDYTRNGNGTETWTRNWN